MNDLYRNVKNWRLDLPKAPGVWTRLRSFNYERFHIDPNANLSSFFCILFLLGFPLLLMGEINWQADIHKPFAMTIRLSKKQIPLDGLLDLEVDFRYPSSYQLNVEEVLDH